MSQAAKRSIIILIIIIGLSLVFSGYLLFQKQQLQSAHNDLQKRFDETENVAKERVQEIVSLKNEKEEIENQRIELEKQLKESTEKEAAVREELTKAQEEIDKWKGQLNTVTGERDKLTANMQRMIKEKIQEATAGLKKQLSDRDTRIQDLKSQLTGLPPQDPESCKPSDGQGKQAIPKVVKGEEHWAEVLRDKAALEVYAEQLKRDLSEKSVQMVELKQGYADLKIELETLQVSQENLNREINQKEDMLKLLSLELARTKNDKKYAMGRVNELQNENRDLRRQMQGILSSKGEMEKKIYRLEQEKSRIERTIQERESIIQGKINEIWDIKESLDKTFKATTVSKKGKSDEGIDLPAITVTSSQAGENYYEQRTRPDREAVSTAGIQGTVLSVNDDNNFVIIDIGEKKGMRIGDRLSIYRQEEYIASIEVIQVRTDISAADIKDQRATINPGDTIR